MPKRVVDGEGVWGSDKLLSLKPEYRPEYANLVPLSEANGVFEADAYKVWSRVYSYNRREITVEWVSGLLQDLVRVGMLLLWEEKGKIWGFWEGNQKAGRLPSPSEQEKYKNLPPRPPKSLLSGSKESPMSLLPRLGMVRLEKERLDLEPAAQDEGEETDMKIKNEIQGVCAGFGIKAGGYKDTWDEMAVLGRQHSVGAVVRDFTEWLEENQGDDFPKGVVSAYLHVAHDRLSGDTAPATAILRDPEVVNLARELSYLSDGQIAFGDKQRIRLAEVLKEFSAEEIIGCFKTWFADQNPDEVSKFGPGKFVQVADSLCYAARKRKQESIRSQVERDAAVLRLQQEAEAERVAAEAEQEKEELLFDPLA